jgi:two-component system response regulator AtoC
METASSLNTVLIGDDDSGIRSFLETALRCRGYRVRTATDGEEVLSQLKLHQDVTAVLLDIMMPRRDGFGALREIRKTRPEVPVIMMSALGSTSNIVQSIKEGATDFITKPVDHEEVWRVLEKAVAVTAAANASAHARLGASEGMFFGDHPSFSEIRSLLPKVGASDLPVLIRGETGTGKEVLAREIHSRSGRAGKPFVKLNCAAIPSELLESELFGYERGAFTGAVQRKSGLFELANGGTLLLDEIGDMDLRLQAKLLHVLQDRGFRRIGGKEDLRLDIRFIAATHRDLEAAIADSTFRQDLYFRLNVMMFWLPSLRAWKDGLREMARFLLLRHSPDVDLSALLSPTLMRAFQEYEWPGNIRELESVIRKLVVLKDPELLERDVRTRSSLVGMERDPALPAAPVQPNLGSPHHALPELPASVLKQASRAKAQAEADAIRAVLHATRWNRKQAATLLDIDYKALLYKMKKLAIDQREEGVFAKTAARVVPCD